MYVVVVSVAPDTVVTNLHVVDGSTPGELYVVNRKLGRPVEAEVVVRTPNGNDYGKDLLRQHLLALESRRFAPGPHPPTGWAAWQWRQRWLERFAFTERVGDRWWPILGAVYLQSAIKRLPGMTLQGPVWRKRFGARASAPVATHRGTYRHEPAEAGCSDRVAPPSA